jgi:hypothetical protein
MFNGEKPVDMTTGQLACEGCHIGKIGEVYGVARVDR